MIVGILTAPEEQRWKHRQSVLLALQEVMNLFSSSFLEQLCWENAKDLAATKLHLNVQQEPQRAWFFTSLTIPSVRQSFCIYESNALIQVIRKQQGLKKLKKPVTVSYVNPVETSFSIQYWRTKMTYFSGPTCLRWSLLASQWNNLSNQSLHGDHDFLTHNLLSNPTP